jgi:alkylated DNA nucleotide flippase Atl1
MSFCQPISRPRRPKLFTDGRQTPIDRNDRARVMFMARAARHRGQITRAAVDILRALLFTFANLRDGRCFPSYERIAEAAGACERTVGRCLPDLEAAGFIKWVNRIRRIRERVAGLAGIGATDWRVVRTSNAYNFPLIAKQKPVVRDEGHFGLGTSKPDLVPTINGDQAPTSPLEIALARLGEAVTGGIVAVR